MTEQENAQTSEAWPIGRWQLGSGVSRAVRRMRCGSLGAQASSREPRVPPRSLPGSGR